MGLLGLYLLHPFVDCCLKKKNGVHWSFSITEIMPFNILVKKWTFQPCWQPCYNKSVDIGGKGKLGKRI